MIWRRRCRRSACLGTLLLDFGLPGLPASATPRYDTAVSYRASELVTVDELAEAIWSDALPEDPRNAVQVYVSRLHKLLGDAELLQGRPQGYVLAVARGDLDVGQFERLVAQARDAAGVGDRGRHEEALACQRESLGIRRELANR
jgi:predicted short-subunit dehydrogenase-like oxidoreductase (DUF2520 family)